MVRSVLMVLVLSSVLGGCSGCDKEEKPRSESKALRPSGEDKLRRRIDAGRMIRGGLQKRLEDEAKSRVDVPLKAETVLAELEKQNVPLQRQRQQPAASHRARFCMGARTGKRAQITVCEHDTDERAEEHVKATQALERPERRIARIGRTTMLIRRDTEVVADNDLVSRAFQVFASLADAGQP